MDKTKRKNILKLCFKLTFTIAALWLVYTKVDFNAFNRIWDQANPWFFIPALLCFTFSQLISSFRLLYFFKNIQLPITVLYNLRLYLQGMFYNIFLPGGVGGDGYKIVILSKQFRNNSRSVFTAIFLDRVSGAWALFFCIIVFGTLVEAAPGFRTIVIAAYIAASTSKKAGELKPVNFIPRIVASYPSCNNCESISPFICATCQPITK